MSLVAGAERLTTRRSRVEERSCARPASFVGPPGRLELVAGPRWGLGTRVLARADLTRFGPALAGWSPSRFVRTCRSGLLGGEMRRTIGRCGRERGVGWRHANIEQWVRSWRGASFSFGNAVPDRLQPEELFPSL